MFEGDARFPPGSVSFVHKRLGRGFRGFLRGGPVGAIAGALRPDDNRAIDRAKRQAALRRRGIREGSLIVGQSGGTCNFPLVVDADGECRRPGSPADRDVGGVMVGAATMGRFGAGLQPTARQRTQLECLPGMVLGDDDLCYNRKDLRNSDRKYPKPRAPLLTGGERNCITKAAAAARKIQRTTKQLEKLGMLKKPSRRAAPKARAPQLMLPPGAPSIINVE